MPIPTIDLRLGDCLDVMKEMEDNSVDSIVTDPPYGLSAARNSGKSSKGGFMGKEWDYDVPSVEIWREALRVLKPGGHLLAFSGTRTYHRMVVNIEDAGFEIRDSIVCWLYGSGFPKSHNISKAIDKAAGAEREVMGRNPNSREKCDKSNTLYESGTVGKTDYITKPATPEAKKWDGWGTALKPAHEPVCVARKPLIGTVVENVLEYGTGALNIDGCRISHSEPDIKRKNFDSPAGIFTHPNREGERGAGPAPEGRWPANVIMDEVAGTILDEQAPMVGNPKSSSRNTDNQGGTGNAWTNPAKKGDSNGFSDGLGGGSRFFYCPKVSQAERNAGCDDLETKTRTLVGQTLWTNQCGECGRQHPQQESVCLRCGNKLERESRSPPSMKNNHPTVKPISLMRYLAKLVTKEGGIVLDPFMGSGSTGIAACLEGFNFVGIEMDEEYLNIARHRIAHWGEYEIEEAEFIPKPRSTQMNISDWF